MNLKISEGDYVEKVNGTAQMNELKLNVISEIL